MKLSPEALQKLDDQIREIGQHLGMEFDQEYADNRDENWNYRAELKQGSKWISIDIGGYKQEGRFIIRGQFPRDKKGQIHRTHNAKQVEITVAMDRGSEKIAKTIQSRLMPEYEKQLAIALENNLKSDAYRDGRLKALRAVALYFGQTCPESDDAAIYPEMSIGIYKIEAVSEGLKFQVECSLEKALEIFEILKKEKEEGNESQILESENQGSQNNVSLV